MVTFYLSFVTIYPSLDCNPCWQQGQFLIRAFLDLWTCNGELWWTIFEGLQLYWMLYPKSELMIKREKWKEAANIPFINIIGLFCVVRYVPLWFNSEIWSFRSFTDQVGCWFGNNPLVWLAKVLSLTLALWGRDSKCICTRAHTYLYHLHLTLRWTKHPVNTIN